MTGRKLFIGLICITFLVLIISIALFAQQTAHSDAPLIGQPVTITSRNHVPIGTKITYNSNPPAGGPHYPLTAHAGMYDKAPLDGFLVHSLEHGAVILWYDPKLPKEQVDELKNIFNSVPQSKKIMTPRPNLGVPVALSSWGRVLKLQKIDKKQIDDFFAINSQRGLEAVPI